MSDQGENKTQHITDVSALRVARVYAEALLNTAEKRGEVDAILDQFDSLIHDVIEVKPLLGEFFTSPAVPAKVKAAAIDKTFAGRASELFIDFLKILNAHDRLGLVRAIFAALRELYDQRARRLRVLVRSAVPLPDDQRDRIRQGVQTAFHLEPILDEQVDPALLGGLVVKVGDLLYDGSVRARLQTLRNYLIARSSHEIQSGRDRFSSPG